ncbi:MAG: dihydropteroate synthase [Armatimonadota bacterium]
MPVIIIGERLNATKKQVGEAIRGRDADFVQQEAQAQAAAGANYLDCNAGRDPATEKDDMVWLIQTVREVCDLPLAIDSANPEVQAAGLAVYQGPPPILNSATAESGKMEAVLDLAQEHDAAVIALALGDAGMPKAEGDREANIQAIIDAAAERGIPPDRIFADPVVEAVSTGLDRPLGPLMLKAIANIRKANPEVHITAGVSNVSYGLPERRLLNRMLLALAMGAGLDTAIIDPCDPHMMATIYAVEALLGLDEGCMNYVQASREGKLEV